MWEREIFFLIEESFKMFAYFFYNLHPLFHLKVPEIPFLNSPLCPHGSFSSRNIVWACGASIKCGHRGTHKIAPASQGSRCRYPSRNRGTRRRGGSKSCLHRWLNAMIWVWWCTPSCPGSPMTSSVASIFFSLEAQQPYLLFSLHSFSFTLTILIFI